MYWVLVVIVVDVTQQELHRKRECQLRDVFMRLASGLALGSL